MWKREAIIPSEPLTLALGSSNPINVVLATYEGLRSLRTADQVAKMRDKSVAELFA